MKKMGAEYAAAVDGHEVPSCRAAVESQPRGGLFHRWLGKHQGSNPVIDGFDFVFAAGLISPYQSVGVSRNSEDGTEG